MPPKWIKPIIILMALSFAVSNPTAFAQPKGAILIDPTTIYVAQDNKQQTYTCLEVGTSDYRAGKMVGVILDYFLAYTTEVQALKAKIAKASGSKKTKLELKLKKLKTKAKRGNSACAAARANPNPGTGPIFDYLGNVTPAGKSKFQIPVEYTANQDTGEVVFNYYCTGCHEPQLNRTFPIYRSMIAQSPMLYDETQISNQQLADLVAYLNRFQR